MSSNLKVNTILPSTGTTVTVSGISSVTSSISAGSSITAANFKTGSSNLHSTGLTVGNNFLHSTGINVGTGATIHVPASNTLTFGTNSNERVRITSAGDVGIGTATPVVASGYGNLSLAGSTGGQLEFKRVSSDIRHYIWGNQDLNIGGGYYNGSSSSIIFRVNGATERLKITSTGILVTGGETAPSSTDVGSIFLKGAADLGWLTSSGSITFNAYYAGGWKYVTSGTSHILWASSEGFNFSTASSGSADGAISYSRAMKIFTNNRVSIGDGNGGSPLAALHIDTKSTMGTDTALWIGSNSDNRYMAIQQNASTEQFSHMDLVYNDNGSRSMINLKNPYGPAGYGAAITWKGYNNGDQGYIECKSEGANSANATMYLNTSGGTFLQANHAKHIRMPSQPSFAAYRNQSTWNVNGAVMVFNATRHNIGNHYDTSNGRFTAPIAGSYQINFFSIYRGNHTNAYVQLYKNGARINGGDIHFTYYDLGTNWDNVSFSQVISLSTGDYLTMYSPNNVDWHGNHWQLFSGYLLG